VFLETLVVLCSLVTLPRMRLCFWSFTPFLFVCLLSIGTVLTDTIVRDNEDEVSHSGDKKTGPGAQMFNFASHAAGAVILDKSPASAKGYHNLLNDDKDKYGISPCAENKWMVIGLSEEVLITSVEIVNYEKYSSLVKDFQLLASSSYPVDDWIDLGMYTAQPMLGKQLFNITNLSDAHTRYLKVKLLSHYSDESLCTLSQIKVYGMTVIASFQQEVLRSDHNVRDMLSTLNEEEEENREGDDDTVADDANYVDFLRNSLLDEKEEEAAAAEAAAIEVVATNEGTVSSSLETLDTRGSNNNGVEVFSNADETSAISLLPDEQQVGASAVAAVSVLGDIEFEALAAAAAAVDVPIGDSPVLQSKSKALDEPSVPLAINSSGIAFYDVPGTGTGVKGVDSESAVKSETSSSTAQSSSHSHASNEQSEEVSSTSVASEGQTFSSSIHQPTLSASELESVAPFSKDGDGAGVGAGGGGGQTAASSVSLGDKLDLDIIQHAQEASAESPLVVGDFAEQQPATPQTQTAQEKIREAVQKFLPFDIDLFSGSFTTANTAPVSGNADVGAGSDADADADADPDAFDSYDANGVERGTRRATLYADLGNNSEDIPGMHDAELHDGKAARLADALSSVEKVIMHTGELLNATSSKQCSSGTESTTQLSDNVALASYNRSEPAASEGGSSNSTSNSNSSDIAPSSYLEGGSGGKDPAAVVANISLSSADSKSSDESAQCSSNSSNTNSSNNSYSSSSSGSGSSSDFVGGTGTAGDVTEGHGQKASSTAQKAGLDTPVKGGDFAVLSPPPGAVNVVRRQNGHGTPIPVQLIPKSGRMVNLTTGGNGSGSGSGSGNTSGVTVAGSGASKGGTGGVNGSSITSSLGLSCFETLTFVEFQKKMMTKLQQKALNASNTTDTGEGGVGAAAALPLSAGSSKDNNVFRSLMQKIKSLEMSNAIMEMFIIQVILVFIISLFVQQWFCFVLFCLFVCLCNFCFICCICN
jgi:hypothetical protein